VESASSSSQGFGVLVHALAEHVVRTGSTDLADLQRRADAVWADLDWEAPWYAEGQRRVAGEVLRRFVRWHEQRQAEHEVVGAEVPFDLTVGRARVTGQIDRLERDAQGRGVVVDLKTGRSAPPNKELAEHPQLGLYQLAVAEGDVGGHAFTGAGGAMLVQLRATKSDAKVQPQPPLEADADGRTWVHTLLDELVEQVVTEQFPARRNSGCDTCEVRRSCPARPEGAQVV
jgi:RecB family exonuclease